MLAPENAPMRAAFIGTGGLLGYMVGAIRGRKVEDTIIIKQN
jgi:hypothetical protein